MEEQDTRQDELETLQAIYPELVISDKDPFTFSIELPVNPIHPVNVNFPAEDQKTHDVFTEVAPIVRGAALRQTDSHELSYLPPLLLTVGLPIGYPDSKPPMVLASTDPSWLPQDVCQSLQIQIVDLWEEIGRDQVVFAYIDRIQTETENVFGLVDTSGALEVDSSHKIAVLDYDIKARRLEFEKQTYNCGICLYPKKGGACHKMLDCGHVFCVDCLQDFYKSAITEGDISSVRCLEPNCAKEREKQWAQQEEGNVSKVIDGALRKRKKKPRTFISPSELLQIPIDSELVKRFVRLKYKNELESDKNTIYCPRKWCQGAARSKKHKKPEGLEFQEGSCDEDEPWDDENKDGEILEGTDRLAICEDCGFAFCRRCYHTWHGEFFQCLSIKDHERISEEEEASLKYISMHTTKCPTCDAPSQKVLGCNHMSCRLCGTHFCYLCSSWLDPSNPYAHFNVSSDGKKTACFNRLWELEEGDGNGDDGIYFNGHPREERARFQEALPHAPAHVRPNRLAQQPEIEELDSDEGEIDRPPRLEVEREGPLILRIEGMPARVPPPAPNPPPAPARGRAAGFFPGNQNGPAVAVGAVDGFDAGHALRGGGGGRERGRGRRGARGMRRRGRGLGAVAGPNPRNNPLIRRQRGPARQPIGPPEIDEMDNNLDAGNNLVDNGELPGDDNLHPAQVAWIRQFVRLALLDEEDNIDDA